MLESLDAMLTQIERLIPESRAGESGIIEVADDLPDAFRQIAPEQIVELRRLIQELGRKIHVTRRRVSKRRMLRGMLSAQMVRVEDITPSRLRSYGEVHASFGEEIFPALRNITRALSDLVDLLED
jgi:hypothetical protein